MKSIDCPLCLSKEQRVVVCARPHRPVGGEEYSIVRCLSCGLTFLNPRPEDHEVTALYRTAGIDGITGDPVPEVAPITWARRLWHDLNYRSPVLSLINAGPVLDVGCGEGVLMEQVRATGIEVSGIESNPRAVARARSKGLNVEHTDILEAAITPGRYRFVVLSHVLEHLPDPVSGLRKLHEALAPEGRLIVVVPNVGSPMARLFGGHWHGWDPPFHLYHFNSRSLRRVLELAGFELREFRQRGSPEDFTRSLALMSGSEHRHLALRVVAWPLFTILGRVGLGSELVGTAAWKDERTAATIGTFENVEAERNIKSESEGVPPKR